MLLPPRWIDYMYARLGNEWAGSLLAFVSLAMSPSELLLELPSRRRLPDRVCCRRRAVPFLFYFYGERIRARSAMAT